MLTIMIEIMARSGSPSQLMRPLMAPRWYSVQLITLKVGSNIQRQANVDSTVGMMKGSNMKARVKALPRKSRFSKHRQPQPQSQLEDGGDGRIEEGVVDRRPEDRVVPDLVIIREAHEIAGDADARVANRQQNAAHERISDEQAEQHDRRNQQHERKPAFVFQQPLPSRLWGSIECAPIASTAIEPSFRPAIAFAGIGARRRQRLLEPRPATGRAGRAVSRRPSLSSPSAHLTASSAGMPCTALAYMSTMMYLESTSPACLLEGPA